MYKKIQEHAAEVGENRQRPSWEQETKILMLEATNKVFYLCLVFFLGHTSCLYH